MDLKLFLRPYRPRLIACALAGSLAGSTGCSLLFVDGPRQAGLDCTTNYVAPVVDAVFATLTTTSLIANFRGKSQMLMEDAPWVIGGGVVLSSTFLSSTYVGFSRVSACNDEISDSDGRQQRERARRRLLELQARESGASENPAPPPPESR